MKRLALVASIAAALVLATPRAAPHFIRFDTLERWEPGRFVLRGHVACIGLSRPAWCPPW